MLRLTDLILDPDRSPTRESDVLLPQATLIVLGRVAPTNLPLLCTACFGAAFGRIAAAVHHASERDELLLIDLRRTAGTIPAGLPRGERARHATLALDGLEHLDARGQDILAGELATGAYRVVSATDAALDLLAARWRPDLFALLATVTVHAPALARRAAEIDAIARERLATLSAALGRPVPELGPDATTALAAYGWPGDLAELDAVLARTLLDCGPRIDQDDLRWRPDGASPGAPSLAATAPLAASPVAAHAGGDPEPDAGAVAAAIALPTATPATPRPLAAGGRSTPAGHPADPSPTLEALAVELAHQLKNPLVTIKTFVASAESLVAEPDELAQFRVLTDEAVSRMDEILDGLLAFARLGATLEEAVDLLPLLRDALRTAWPALASKQVTLEAPEGASLVARADREHLRFAFATLARHVAETIEPRSTLAIAVEPDGTLRFAYRESGAITHLRGVAGGGDSGLPLALLLVRGALGRVGGDVQIALDGTDVSIRLRLSPP